MPSLIKDLYIFSKGGVPIIDLYKTGDLDKSFLGGFISAIESFSRKISGCEIKGFKVGKYKFCLVHCFDNNVIIVVKAPYEAKKKKIENMCSIVEKIFEEIFDLDEIKNWNGDINIFKRFKTKLELYFKMGSL
jgi:hypothetical protein